MDKLSIDLENCYGIKKLVHQFDFTQRKAYAIYAPNGAMKSSFAETFKNIADEKLPEDRIFPARMSVAKIYDENGTALPPESVLVLSPYDSEFQHTEKTSTLLVNNKLRKEFERLHKEIDEAKENFLKVMKSQSGSKKQLEHEISTAFTNDKNPTDETFWDALFRIQREIQQQKDTPFVQVEYDKIFDDRALAFLGKKEIQAALKEYITRYNELIAKSTFFQQGVFEYYNASQIAKILTKNGFFAAKHSVTFNSAEKKVISTEKELEELVAAELEEITTDKKLKQQFAAIKKDLEGHEQMRGFRTYLCAHETLLPELENIDRFKERIWKSYIKKHDVQYNELLDKYNKVKDELQKISEEAGKERTQWEVAIDLFNERFSVPFKLEAKNKVQVLFGTESILNLAYTFEEGADKASVTRDNLMRALSQGEKKALYILNIIFEIERRKNGTLETLFVVDDIADSFDYKNKYAIVQYLQEISVGPVFKQIILTHNFDFFRTIEGRVVGYKECLMATRDSAGIKLNPAEGIQNIFIKKWKGRFFTDDKMRVASIPFMRNLIEYTLGDADADYLKLTSLLHCKVDSGTITQGELDRIYNKLFGGTGAYPNPTGKVVDLIEQEANRCLTAQQGVNFENKIVLSIAIRFFSDKFMAAKIADPAFVAGIISNQTRKLFVEFQNRQGGDASTIKVLEGVCLMTPENLHLNAFMYEPILDMSDGHLRDLYQKVRALK